MTVAERTAVGFIGLGNIGAPMASRMSKWPGGLVVHDMFDDAVNRFVDKSPGVTMASSPAQVAEHASIILLMVQNAEQVQDVLNGTDGILASAKRGDVVAIHSTINPSEAIRFGELAEPYGVHVVDAPVSGGAIGAHEGTLAIMVGGETEALDKCSRVFGYLGSVVVHMGPLGAGTRTKVARNLITFASFAAVGEAQRIAEAAGLDLVKLGEVVRHSDQVTSGPGAIMLRQSAAELSAEDGLRPIFEHTATLGAKDLGLAIAMAQELGVDSSVAELASKLLRPALGLDPVPDGL